MRFWKETERKDWSQIKDEVVLLQENGIIPNNNYQEKPTKYFANEYSKWKLKQKE